MVLSMLSFSRDPRGLRRQQFPNHIVVNIVHFAIVLGVLHLLLERLVSTSPVLAPLLLEGRSLVSRKLYSLPWGFRKSSSLASLPPHCPGWITKFTVHHCLHLMLLIRTHRIDERLSYRHLLLNLVKELF